LPEENSEEGEIVDGIVAYPFSTLSDLVDFLRDEKEFQSLEHKNYEDILVEPPSDIDFSDVKGNLTQRGLLRLQRQAVITFF